MKISAFVVILACIFHSLVAQGPRKYRGRSTSPPPTAAAKALYNVMSKCQICLTIKYEMNNKMPTSPDICDDSERLRWNADVCEDIINTVMSKKLTLENHCTILCQLSIPSKKVVNRRSLLIAEIE